MTSLTPLRTNQGFFTYECMRKYCQAQGRMVGPAAAVALAAIPTLPLLTSDWFGL